MAAPSFGASGAHLTGSGNSAAFAVPAGVVAGSVVVIPLFLDGAATITDYGDFAEAPSSPQTVAGSGGHSLHLLWKRAVGGDSGTYSFTFSTSTYRAGQAIRYDGVIASGDPWDVTDGASSTALSTVTPAVSVTTTGADQLLIFQGTNWSGGAWTPPTGFTERMDTGDRINTLADKVQAAAGSSGSVTATCASSDRRNAWLGALKLGPPFLESFNKADGAPLGPNLNWTQVSGGTWHVTANQASPSGASHGDVAYARAEHDTASADQYAEFTVVAADIGDQGGPCVRFDAAANTSYMAMYQNGAVTLRKTVNGTRSNLSSAISVFQSLPQVLRVEIEGSTLTGFWDGAQVVQVTDTSIPTGTRAGIYSDEASGNFILDNFEFGDLGGGGPTPAEVTATIPLSLALGAASETVHSSTVAIPLTLDVDASSEAVHQATAPIALTVDLDGVTDAPTVGVNQVTAEIPVSVALAADAVATHQVIADIPLNVDLSATADAPTPGVNEVTAEIPLTLLVSATAATAHRATAPIPLDLAVEPVTATQYSATASINLALALSAVGQSEPLPDDPRVFAMTPVTDRRLLVPVPETLALIPILED